MNDDMHDNETLSASDTIEDEIRNQLFDLWLAQDKRPFHQEARNKVFELLKPLLFQYFNRLEPSTVIEIAETNNMPFQQLELNREGMTKTDRLAISNTAIQSLKDRTYWFTGEEKITYSEMVKRLISLYDWHDYLRAGAIVDALPQLIHLACNNGIPF